MSAEKKSNGSLEGKNYLSGWLSTYGLVTAVRVLDRCHIHLQQEEVERVILSPNTFYHHLIQVPLKNVLNGIILQQAQDYRIYLEKLFTDYFFSDHAAPKSIEDSGFQLAQKLEGARLSFVTVSQTFQQHVIEHRNLIAKTQQHLIEIAQSWEQRLRKAMEVISQHLGVSFTAEIEAKLRAVLHTFLIANDSASSTVDWHQVTVLLKQSLTPDLESVIAQEIEELRQFMQATMSTLTEHTGAVRATMASLIKFRTEFYDLILQIHELIAHLPHPAMDFEKLKLHRESLIFDLNFGEADNQS